MFDTGLEPMTSVVGGRCLDDGAIEAPYLHVYVYRLVWLQVSFFWKLSHILVICILGYSVLGLSSNHHFTDGSTTSLSESEVRNLCANLDTFYILWCNRM